MSFYVTSLFVFFSFPFHFFTPLVFLFHVAQRTNEIAVIAVIFIRISHFRIPHSYVCFLHEEIERNERFVLFICFRLITTPTPDYGKVYKGSIKRSQKVGPHVNHVVVLLGGHQKNCSL